MYSGWRWALKRFVPSRWRRLYRKYVSPLIRDAHYYEYAGREDFFRRAFTALAFNGIQGDYAEFGCCGGMTFGLAYRHSRRQGNSCRLWAFDSFAGLPAQAVAADRHPIWIKGDMSIGVTEFRQICKEHGIPEADYRIVEGYYADTLGTVGSNELPEDICLAYIDCDLYSSTKAVLGFLTPRLKHGMILALDDYHCWSSTQTSGERKACGEYFRDNPDWDLVPFAAYGWGGMSFMVESKTLGMRAGACY